MTNQDIRIKIQEAGIKYWQVADSMNKSVCTLSVWLRKPLEGEKKELVLDAIEKAKKEYGEDAK